MRKILIGLGNPGENYKNTYHNAGAIAVAAILARFLPDAKYAKEKGARLWNATEIKTADGDVLIFVRTKTFMNESGLAVKDILKYFSAEPEEVVLLHDDSDLRLGDIKISESKNLAGHHGLLSVENETGVSNFKRVRVGIRNPSELVRKKAGEFVLKNIPKNKLAVLLQPILREDWLAILRKS
jgi:PTH1 family peptidyl-tRNA hydrolase